MVAAVVLRRRSDTELLSIRPIRPELVVPMVEPSSASVADCDSDPYFFHRYMDRLPLHILPRVEKPLMGAPGIRHGTRSPSLGTDSLEYLEYGPLSTLDSWTDRKRCGWTVIMVVAGSAGRGTGRW